MGLSRIRYWNNIYSNTIRIGQRIIVYVDPGKADYYSRINKMSLEEKLALSGKVSSSTTAQIQPADDDASDPEYVIYTVRYGDTIWDIVKKFDNVTTTEVLSLNNISDPGKIQVGQKLKIKKKI